MANQFAILPAHGPNGERPNEMSPDQHGLFQFNVDGSKFSMISLGDCQVTMAFLNGGASNFEPLSLRIWRALAVDARLVLDIGAYTGIYSLIAFAANPNSTIVAFEASQTTFGRLLHNILVNRADGRIAPVHKAISRSSGTLELILHGGIYTMSSGESLENFSHFRPWAKKRVETISMDEIILDWDRYHPGELTLARPASGVSIVKIDVEGHEKAVLSGMTEIIRRDRPTFFVEVLEASDLPEIIAAMPGYKGFWIGEGGVVTSDFQGGGNNTLLIHTDNLHAVSAVTAGIGAPLPL